MREDMKRGSVTLFSRRAALNKPLDSLVVQLLRFGEEVGTRMDGLPNGGEEIKLNPTTTSWRSLIIAAIARPHESSLSLDFSAEAERCSPFALNFSWARGTRRLVSRQRSIYDVFFDAFLEARAGR